MEKSYLSKHSHAVVGIVCGLALMTGLFVYRAKADEWNRQTVLTVSQTMQVEDTVLPPGKYVLKVFDSNANRHIVQIFNAEQNHVYATVFAIPTERMKPTGDTQFVFWETPGGTARALRDWYYPGRLTGDEFTYPKHPLQIAQAQPAPVAAAPPPPPAEPERQPVAETPAPPPAQEPVEVAQNTPPPPPAPAAPLAAAVPEPAAQTLPQTASPYPLFGFAGIGSLALLAGLRLRDTYIVRHSAD